MKILFTGPSGVGKTTLVEYIKTIHPELNHISGSASSILLPQYKKMLKKRFDYDGQGHKWVIRKGFENPDFADCFQECLLNSRFTSLNGENIISDRSYIDNLVFYLLQVAPFADDSKVLDFVTKVRLLLEQDNITHIIRIKCVNDFTEDNGSRIANNHFQKVVDKTFDYALELVDHYVNPVLTTINIWDLQKRKEIIKTILSAQKTN